MIYIDIHDYLKIKANICRFVLSPWGNYGELTEYVYTFSRYRNRLPLIPGSVV